MIRLTESPSKAAKLLSPPAKFRSLVTEAIKTGKYVPASVAEDAATAIKMETTAIVATLARCRVPAGARSYSRLPAAAQKALQQLHVRQTAAQHPEALSAMLKMGFGLLPSCAALGDCASSGHTLELAVARLASLPLAELCLARSYSSESPMLSPPARFRGLVTDVIQTGAYTPPIPLVAKRESDKLGQLQEALANSGLLSPPGSVPPSPERQTAMQCVDSGSGGVPDLQLSKGASISGSRGIESQLRIMKQLFDDGLVPPKVFIGIGACLPDHGSKYSAI